MAALVSVVGCKSDLDINRDPYLPVEATPKLLLPTGIAYSASKIGGDIQNIGSFWSQHATQNNTSSQYKTLDQYSVGVADYNSIWTSVFGGGLKDLAMTMEMSKASGAWNYYIAASIMSVFDYHVLVDLYGKLPYTEGLLGDKNKAPQWEDGKVVNAKLIIQLDEAIAKGPEAIALPRIGDEDFLFQGDMTQWIKFAKTLKLKILMRDFAANQTAIQALLTEGDLLATFDAKMTGFADLESKSNPLYEYDRRKLNTFFNIKASNTLLNFLKENNDTRIPVFFEEAIVPAPEGAPIVKDYLGLDQGNFTITGLLTNNTSRTRLAPTDAVYFTSAAESKFLQAEAWARLGDAGKAKTAYNEAVTLAFARWGQEAKSFINAGGAYEFKGGTTEQMVKAIITQKWVAAVRCQAWDSFFDQNRTGYPVVSTVGSASPAYVKGEYTISVNSSLGGTELPRRLLYPKISADFNPNTPKAVAINTKMWWHKQ